MINIKSAFAATALAVAACTSAVAAVGYSSASISIDTFATGGAGATGSTAIVATLLMTANGSNVDFKLSNSLDNLAAGGSGFLTELLLSYDNDPVITGANIGSFGGSQLATGASVASGGSGVFTDGGYKFKISFDYPNSNADRFVNGENSTWTITGVTIEDFLTADAANSGALAMVHLQGLGQAPGYSVKYVGDLDDGTTDPGGNPAPEPGSLALVGLALAGLGFMSRRRRA